MINNYIEFYKVLERNRAYDRSLVGEKYNMKQYVQYDQLCVWAQFYNGGQKVKERSFCQLLGHFLNQSINITF